MSRKIFVWLVATILLTTASLTNAQQPKKVPRIGLLSLASGPAIQDKEFLQGLRDLGYIEGENIVIEYRWAAGKMDHLPPLAEELVRLKVDVIVVRTTPVVQAARNATRTIPIVMLGAADPVGIGFVASLARPGGNITGMSSMMPELAGKRLGLLREILPKLSRVAFLGYRGDPATRLFIKETEEAAEKLKMKFQPVTAAPEELERAFAETIKERAGALIIQPIFINNLGLGKTIAKLAVKHRLPTVSDGSPFAEEGGLMFYGPNQKVQWRRAATYVDKILKGANPAELPVEQPTKFELIINLQTATQIGLTIPPNVLARADKVIK